MSATILSTSSSILPQSKHMDVRFIPPLTIWHHLCFLFLFCDNSLTGEAFRDSDRLISPNACSVVHILLSMFSWSCVCVVVKLCAFGFVGVRVRVCVRMQSLCLCICSLYDLLVSMCELMHVCKFIGCVLHYNVFVYWYYCAHTVVSEMCASDKWVHADECVYFCQCAWV